MKKLPREFSIMGCKVTIEYEKSLNENMGIVFPDAGKIKVVKNNLIPRDSTEASVFHEMAHYILFIMNETKLYANEKFVDSLGRILHQIWLTLK